MTTIDDLSSLSAIVTNEYVRKYLFDDEILEHIQIEDILNRSVLSFQRNGYGLWLIHHRSSNYIAGMVGLWTFFDEPQPQLLYALLPAYVGNGIASEASLEILRYAFDTLGFDYLIACCDTPNENSHRVAKRIGMVKTKEEIINGKATTFYRIDRTPS
jgi:ribosomal-protein-alanine N-acetyltransferase